MHSLCENSLILSIYRNFYKVIKKANDQLKNGPGLWTECSQSERKREQYLKNICHS